MTRKNKNKKRKPAKSVTAKSDLWLYILILLLCGGIVWLLTQKPKTRVKPVKETALGTQPFDQNKLVKALEEKFGMEPGSIVPKEIRKVIRLEIPVDRSKMDLTYANVLVSNEFRSMRAVQDDGKVDGSKQILSFTHADKNFEVILSYAPRTAQQRAGKKYISIVVDDFGSVEGETLQEWLALPTQITFAIMPGFKQSVNTMTLADQQGRETLVHVPMEPIGYPRQNPGENAILVQMNQAQVERTLLKHLNSLPLCMGVNNHMGSLATADNTIMGWVMDVLKKKNKGFLDSRTSNVSIAYQVAQKARIPAWRNDIFLDSPDITDETLERKINAIQDLATRNSTVVVITHCHNPEKLIYLHKFLDRVQALGFTLIPLSQVGKTDLAPII
ncbi:MAG: divergent polysaccharide deacetylase family protein [Candidatus Cloacimonetes bacterium]|nr:divergent polysaccharide deacetylase family protein [Candidatus Cloacimonadota bacterium]